ncbi:unnamed protein product [Prorocentrum cordatum]|nr:unnamed protein product [Polarella glacialis]
MFSRPPLNNTTRPRFGWTTAPLKSRPSSIESQKTVSQREQSRPWQDRVDDGGQEVVRGPGEVVAVHLARQVRADVGGLSRHRHQGARPEVHLQEALDDARALPEVQAVPESPTSCSTSSSSAPSNTTRPHLTRRGPQLRLWKRLPRKELVMMEGRKGRKRSRSASESRQPSCVAQGTEMARLSKNTGAPRRLSVRRRRDPPAGSTGPWHRRGSRPGRRRPARWYCPPPGAP